MRLRRGENAASPIKVGLEELWREASGLRILSGAGLGLHHLRQALRGLSTSPATSFLTVITIAVSLAVLGVVTLGLENASVYLAATQQDVSLSVFVKNKIVESDQEALRLSLEGEPEVLSVLYVGKREALEEFRKSLGQEAALLEGLEAENPLPASFVVKLREGDRSAFATLASKYRKHPAVDQVQFNEGLVGQLGTLIRSFKLGGLLCTVLVLVMSASIIGSAIKLALYSRRDEVEIMHLVGASSSFIRTPYVIEGAVQGVLGSLLSIVFVYFLYLVLNQSVAQSSFLSLVIPQLLFLSGFSKVLLIGTGVIVGIGGSYAALRGFRPD